MMADMVEVHERDRFRIYLIANCHTKNKKRSTYWPYYERIPRLAWLNRNIKKLSKIPI